MHKQVAGLALAIAVACFAVVGVAQAQDIQTLDVGISPSKLDKKKPTSIGLTVNIDTEPNSTAAVNQDQPPNTSRTVVDFPKNLSFDTDKAPYCKGTLAELDGTSVETATEVCGKKSIISDPALTSAHVTFDTNPVVPDSTAVMSVPVTVTVFNGPEKNELVFHSRADAVNTTTILDEELKKAKGKEFGTSLITNIPRITAGGVDNFHIVIEKGTIVSGVCKQKRSKLRLTSTFVDNYMPPVFTSESDLICKQKTSKK